MQRATRDNASALFSVMDIEHAIFAVDHEGCRPIVCCRNVSRTIGREREQTQPVPRRFEPQLFTVVDLESNLRQPDRISLVVDRRTFDNPPDPQWNDASPDPPRCGRRVEKCNRVGFEIYAGNLNLFIDVRVLMHDKAIHARNEFAKLQRPRWEGQRRTEYVREHVLLMPYRHKHQILANAGQERIQAGAQGTRSGERDFE